MEKILCARAVSENSTVTDFLLLALVFGVLLVRLLLSPPIWHHGEAREGLVVQGIVHHHQWILPFRNGELPSKPPLYHWIAALFALIFGLSDFIVRLPSAMGAEIAIIAVFLLGKAMDDRKTGWLAVGALLGTYEFWDAATQARVDMIFAGCVTVSLAAFFFWYRDRSGTAQAACYLASACAVLAKGPGGIILPGLVILGFLVAGKEFRIIREFRSWRWIGAVLVLDLGWYALAYHVGGAEFFGTQFVHENVDRFLGADGFSTRFTLGDFLTWLATRTFPWNLALLWCLFRRLRGEPADSAGRFLHAWWIAILVFFALAAGKRAVYLLPLCPPIALLAARALRSFVASLEDSSRLAAAPGAWFAPQVALRPQNLTRLILIVMLLVDLPLLLMKTTLGEANKWRADRLAFIDRVAAAVPDGSPLFAVPELPATDVIVDAYRLGRDIARKSCADGDRQEFFLAPLDRVQDRGGTKVLAFSDHDRMALVATLANQDVVESQDNFSRGRSTGNDKQVWCKSPQ